MTPSNSSLHTSRWVGLVCVAPALLIIICLFLLPLLLSMIGSVQTEQGWSIDHYVKACAFYWGDIVFTIAILIASTLLIGLFSAAIGGYLTLGTSPKLVSTLRWLYRWPLFIPFIVAGQIARTFLAKNGLMNGALLSTGLFDPFSLSSWLDWRGIISTFVWKQTPFVALLVAGAMASLDRSMIESAQNLGASRLRIFFDIVLPQVKDNLFIGMILSFVTMMSVLSVPLMVASQSPTMISVDMAFRINSYGDYGVANALGVISLAITACVAWFYLRHAMRNN